MTKDLVLAQLPVSPSPALWEARAAWWASRVIYWGCEPMADRDRENGLQNAYDAMQDARRGADDARQWASFLDS